MIHVMSYFTEADEALHLAVSTDGRRFDAVAGGQPVLRGTVGTGRLRDPFIGVGPGGVFHLLATDGWTSSSIVHATSHDLLTWSRQELIPVMAAVDGAHNAWAPEFFPDPATGRYHLIWSSVVDLEIPADGRDFFDPEPSPPCKGRLRRRRRRRSCSSGRPGFPHGAPISP